ncbi:MULTISPECIES: hypothetical protein [unclassified Streptomyces]|uniref:hypothetical protein n=1 Tax=unclassified Streptomyces TaxID=2593676 RepID=UPI003815C596
MRDDLPLFREHARSADARPGQTPARSGTLSGYTTSRDAILVASMAGVVRRQSLPDLTVDVAAELRSLSSVIVCELWTDAADDAAFGAIACQALNDVRPLRGRFRPET